MQNDIDHFVFDLLDGPIEISSGAEKENFIPSGYYLLVHYIHKILFFLNWSIFILAENSLFWHYFIIMYP